MLVASVSQPNAMKAFPHNRIIMASASIPHHLGGRMSNKSGQFACGKQEQFGKIIILVDFTFVD
jgi:hypothetical protein